MPGSNKANWNKETGNHWGFISPITRDESENARHDGAVQHFNSKITFVSYPYINSGS